MKILARLTMAALVAALAAAVPAHACDGAIEFTGAAGVNAKSRQTLIVSPFGRAERGWRIYEPQIGRTIGTNCGATTTVFAAALARFQRAFDLSPTGEMDETTLAIMKRRWQAARPFSGGCPEGATADMLADVTAK